MKFNNKYDRQIEINDLIDDAVTNALRRRELVALSEQEAANIAGGLTIEQNAKLPIKVDEIPYIVAGFKPIYPCLPTRPVCFPKKPICPPITVGLIALPPNQQLPDEKNLLNS